RPRENGEPLAALVAVELLAGRDPGHAVRAAARTGHAVRPAQVLQVLAASVVAAKLLYEISKVHLHGLGGPVAQEEEAPARVDDRGGDPQALPAQSREALEKGCCRSREVARKAHFLAKFWQGHRTDPVHQGDDPVKVRLD